MPTAPLDCDVTEGRSHPRLPPELLLDIFEQFAADLFNTKQDASALLHALCNVCRAWWLISRRFLYRRVVLTNARSARSFAETLRRSKYGALVEELFVWTSVYEYPGAVGRGEWQPSRLSKKSVPGDRFMDTVLKRCPHLRHLSIQNRTTNIQKSIVLPNPIKFSVDIFDGIRSMELDARHCQYGRGFWIVRAASAGRLSFPTLEELRLCFRGSYFLNDKWKALPRLRLLVVADAAAYHYPSLQALLNAASVLEDLRLYRLPDDQGVRITLPLTIARLSLWDCPFPLPQLSSFLAPCASTLTDLELDVFFTNTTGEEPTWPEFRRLRSLKTTWRCISRLSVTFLPSVLPTLRILEIVGRSEEEAAVTPSTAIIDLVLNSPRKGLERMLVMGNASLDVNTLVRVLHSLPHLRAFGIGIDVDWLPKLLVQLPVDLDRLDLHIEGKEEKISHTLRNTLPSFLLQSASLKTICIVEQSAEVRVAERRSTISQFRSAVERIESPRIVFEVQDEIDTMLWSFDPAPVEDELGLWPAIYKRWRAIPSDGPVWLAIRLLIFVGRVGFWTLIFPKQAREVFSAFLWACSRIKSKLF